MNLNAIYNNIVAVYFICDDMDIYRYGGYAWRLVT